MYITGKQITDFYINVFLLYTTYIFKKINLNSY